LIITFLGTGTSQGVPVIGCNCEVCTSSDPADNRLRSSVHILANEQNIVIDTGPDFRQQMLREDIKVLDAVLFTHHHKDHVAGMDDIRSYNFLLRKAIPIFANHSTKEQLVKEFEYVFEPNGYGGGPKVVIHEINSAPFHFGSLEISPIEVFHDKLLVFGYKIGDFTYITDANYISDKECEKIYGSRILILNALQQKPHPSHFTLEEALEQIEKINPGEAYLTHISHKMGLHSKVSSLLPSNVHLAYDGLKLKI
jgi:phosphoribosyl 1,2-cyclic phosphate phosphodiesterase